MYTAMPAVASLAMNFLAVDGVAPPTDRPAAAAAPTKNSAAVVVVRDVLLRDCIVVRSNINFPFLRHKDKHIVVLASSSLHTLLRPVSSRLCCDVPLLSKSPSRAGNTAGCELLPDLVVCSAPSHVYNFHSREHTRGAIVGGAKLEVGEVVSVVVDAHAKGNEMHLELVRVL